MGGFISSVADSATNAVNNTIGSVTDFIKAPAATISSGVTQQRDQAVSYGVNHGVQDYNLVTGKSNVGSWFDNQSMRDTNAAMAPGTGTGDNSGARGIRNTVAVAAAIYGGYAAYGKYGAGMGGGAKGATQADMIAEQDAGLQGASWVDKGKGYLNDLHTGAGMFTGGGDPAPAAAVQATSAAPVKGSTMGEVAVAVAVAVGVKLLIL